MCVVCTYSMSIKPNNIFQSAEYTTLSECSSSPEDNVYYLAQSYMRTANEIPSSSSRDADKHSWKSYLTSSSAASSAVDLIAASTSASSIFSHINSTDEPTVAMSNQVSFLYDYYGMTEETRQDPPSPGHSSPASVDEKDIGGIDIPSRNTAESPVLEIAHSFPESGKSVTGLNLPNETSLSSRSYPASSVSFFGSKDVKGLPFPTCQVSCSKTSTLADSQGSSKIFSQFPMCNEDTKYVFVLEAQTSVVQKRGEDTLTYLNKGQFYNITFEGKPTKHKRVKSIFHLVFRDEKDEQGELNHWKYWYNQQPNPNQRAFDIDRKACQNIEEKIEEVGYNALAFKWDPNVQAKISLRINCLSTDFSPQKGVRGIPFHLQVDTYEDMGDDARPIHRAFCQIKVFRDKGAERKNKDESRAVGKRMHKFMKQGPPESPNANMPHVFQLGNKVTILHSTNPLPSKSVIFIPKDNLSHTIVASKPSKSLAASSTTPPTTVTTFDTNSTTYFSHIRERESKRGFNTALSNAKVTVHDELEHLDVYPRFKLPRVTKRKLPAVTIYVRKEEEKAYHALMLEILTLDELKSALSRKYNIPFEMIKSVFKKTKKGILVNVDDQLVEHFVDEDDFLVSIDFDNHLGHFEVVMSC